MYSQTRQKASLGRLKTHTGPHRDRHSKTHTTDELMTDAHRKDFSTVWNIQGLFVINTSVLCLNLQMTACPLPLSLNRPMRSCHSPPSQSTMQTLPLLHSCWLRVFRPWRHYWPTYRYRDLTRYLKHDNIQTVTQKPSYRHDAAAIMYRSRRHPGVQVWLQSTSVFYQDQSHSETGPQYLWLLVLRVSWRSRSRVLDLRTNTTRWRGKS